MKKHKWTPEQVVRLRKRMKHMNEFEFGSYLKEIGFRRIGSGISRDVYRYPASDFVVKLGIPECNKREQEFSEIIPRRFVARVFACYKDLLIMQYIRGRQCPYEDSPNWKQCRPPSCSMISDWHPGNHVHVGSSNRPVTFDLGYAML